MFSESAIKCTDINFWNESETRHQLAHTYLVLFTLKQRALKSELYVPQMTDTHYKGIGKNPNYPTGFALLYKRQCFCNVNTVD